MTESSSTVNEPDNVEQYLSVIEAAEMLGVSPEIVRAHLRQGTLPGEKIGNRWTVQLTAPSSTFVDPQRVTAATQDYLLAESSRHPSATNPEPVTLENPWLKIRRLHYGFKSLWHRLLEFTRRR